MRSLSVHDKSPNRRAPKRLAAWFLLNFCAVAGVAAALIAASFGAVKSDAISETVSPSLPLAGTTAASTSVTFRGAAASATGGERSFAFGYLEYDWDPNAPGGVPGFD